MAVFVQYILVAAKKLPDDKCNFKEKKLKILLQNFPQLFVRVVCINVIILFSTIKKVVKVVDLYSASS